MSLTAIQVFSVSIVNDTNSAVVVRDCDDFCSSSPLRFDLQPGDEVRINRATNMHKYFSVTSTTGRHIGCLDLYFKAPQPGATVPVSEAAACPTGSGVPWKALGVGLLALVVLGAVFFGQSRRV